MRTSGEREACRNGRASGWRRRSPRAACAALVAAAVLSIAAVAAPASAESIDTRHHRHHWRSHQAHHRWRRGERALEFALAQLGKPYEYGGTGPDAYDCSGLSQRAWEAAGVWIPRTSQEQADIGTEVSLDEAMPGDLVVFYADASHVGIYAGDGLVVVAPHPGAYVRLEQIAWMPVYSVRRPG